MIRCITYALLLLAVAVMRICNNVLFSNKCYNSNIYVAVLKVLTDILYAVNDGNLSVLALLDLSAAFDAVDHDILLTWVKVSFSIGGAALDWFQSYLISRVECVRRGSARSTHNTVLFGVPQGSVLGLLLFILYTVGLIDLIEGHSLKPHLYADDTALVALGLPTSSSPPCQLA